MTVEQLRRDIRGDINEAVLRARHRIIAAILCSSAMVVAAVALLNR